MNISHYLPSAKEISILRRVSQQTSMPTNEEIFACFEVIGDMGDVVAYHKTLTTDNFPGYEVFILSGDKSFQPIHYANKSLERAVISTLRVYMKNSKKINL